MTKSGMMCSYVDDNDHIICMSVCVVDKNKKMMYKSKMFFPNDYDCIEKFTTVVMDYTSGVKIMEHMKLPEKEAICESCGKYENIRVPWLGNIQYCEA